MGDNQTKSFGSPSNYPWDLFFIIGAPAISFLMISLMSTPRFMGGHFLYDPNTPDWFIIFAGLITHFHVMMVFVRSHGNKKIFKRYPFRFIAAPLILLLFFWISPVFAGLMVIVTLYWDEWHTQMQTFGFARIFDARIGNDPNVGRKLDMMMVFVLGLFPHMVLLTYIPETDRAEGLITYLMINKGFVDQYGYLLTYLRYPIVALGLSYTLFYVAQYWRMVRKGYKISSKKLALMAVTAVSTMFVASFYSLADGFYFFNIYHSLQYIYFVFFSETTQVASRFNTPKIKKEIMIYLTGFAIFIAVLLLAIARDMTTVGFVVNVWVLSSLLHFWYDGFIWSVRRQEV